MAASSEQTTTSDDTHLAVNMTANDGYYTSGDAPAVANSDETFPPATVCPPLTSESRISRPPPPPNQHAAVDTLRAEPFPLLAVHPCQQISPHELELKSAMDDVFGLKSKHAELSDLINREVGTRRCLEGRLSQRKGVEDELPRATKKLAAAAAKFLSLGTN